MDSNNQDVFSMFHGFLEKYWGRDNVGFDRSTATGLLDKFTGGQANQMLASPQLQEAFKGLGPLGDFFMSRGEFK
jgi:hypothetical protein